MLLKKGMLLLCLLVSLNTLAQNGEQVYFTTGLKVGEVTDSSAIILTRLCASEAPVPVYHARKPTTFRSPLDFDNDMPIHEMDGAVEGSEGEVKIFLSSADTTIGSAWITVSEDKDYTIKQQFTGLKPGTPYQVKILGRKGKGGTETTIEGRFQTVPAIDEAASATFTASSCQYFWSFDDSVRGFKIYDSMAGLNPDFHFQTGDYIYYDKPGPMAYNVALARHKWHAMNAWPSLVDFYKSTASYQLKDDHDLLDNDATPASPPFGELTFADGLDIWYEQVPVLKKPYRTIRWGKDLQIWLVEGREYRSDNALPDGKDKTIWGADQMAWFKQTVAASEATFKILVSATPLVGPDREKGKTDNHANKSFETEGEWLRAYLSDHNFHVINGDRHWQYVSKDLGNGLLEFSSGPSSNSHAQGWDPDDVKPEHQFLRVKGGFLQVKVFREDNVPTIKFLHHDVEGHIVNEETFTAG